MATTAIGSNADLGIPWKYFNLINDGFISRASKAGRSTAEARREYDAALAEKVLEYKPELIVLAGWMHIFSEAFLEPVEKAGGRIINLHPALPGTSSLRELLILKMI
jgi:phosphoribosylglycinamide formyltransferase